MAEERLPCRTGLARGDAMELEIFCDVRAATKNTRVGMPGIKAGIPSVLDAALYCSSPSG